MKKISSLLFSLGIGLSSFQTFAPKGKKQNNTTQQEHYKNNTSFFDFVEKKLKDNDFLDAVVDKSFFTTFLQKNSFFNSLKEEEKRHVYRQTFPFFLKNLINIALKTKSHLKSQKRSFFFHFDDFLDKTYEEYKNQKEGLTFLWEIFQHCGEFLPNKDADNVTIHGYIKKIFNNIDSKVNKEVEDFMNSPQYFYLDFQPDTHPVEVRINSVADFLNHETFSYSEEYFSNGQKDLIKKNETHQPKILEKIKDMEIKTMIRQKIDDEKARTVCLACHTHGFISHFPSNDIDLMKYWPINDFIKKEIIFYKINYLFDYIKSKYDYIKSKYNYIQSNNDCDKKKFSCYRFLNFLSSYSNSFRFKNIDLCYFLAINAVQESKESVELMKELKQNQEDFKTIILQKNKEQAIFSMGDLLLSEYRHLEEMLTKYYSSEINDTIYIEFAKDTIRFLTISLQDLLNSIESDQEGYDFSLNIKDFFEDLTHYIHEKNTDPNNNFLLKEHIEEMKSKKNKYFPPKNTTNEDTFDTIGLSLKVFKKSADWINNLKIATFPSSSEDGEMLRNFFQDEN